MRGGRARSAPVAAARAWVPVAAARAWVPVAAAMLAGVPFVATLVGVPVAAVFVGTLAGCGYRPLYGGSRSTADDSPRDPAELYAVIGGPGRVPSVSAMASAEAGARAELARAGRLAACSPRAAPTCRALVIEILRVEEDSAGIALAHADGGDPGGGSGVPLARGVRVTITGRGHIQAQEPGGGRDTGDVRAAEVVSRGDGDLARHSLAREDAIRLAARRLGERLARRILGIPDASEE